MDRTDPRHLEEAQEESARSQFAALGPLIGGALLIQLAAGILNIVIPVQMVLADQTPTVIGYVASSYAAGFLIGCFGCPTLIGRLGYVRAFMVFGSLQAVFCLGFLVNDFAIWSGVRFGTGLAGAGAAIVIESWISSRASYRHRGRLFSTYNVLSRLAMITGQIAASTAFFATSGAFVLVGVLYALSLGPVCMRASASRQKLEMGGIALRQLWSTAPVAAIGCLYVGMVGSSLVGIVPAWGLLSGLSAGAASLLAASVLIGSLILQWPMGYLSDHVDRRNVIAGAASAALGLALIILLVPPHGSALLYLMFAMLGGVTLPIYAISISHAFDRAQGARSVGLSSSLLFCWALGSIIGPIAATKAMEQFGSAGLPSFIAGLGALSLLALVPHITSSQRQK